MPFATIDQKKCFYIDKGKGFPVLFGHSYLWSSKMWQPQLENLSQEFRCIAVDLWSHGESEENPGKYVLKDIAELNFKLMQALNISEFAVVGLSVGGMWGVELALAHKEAVKALVLMDTFVGSEPPDTKAKYFGMLDIIEASKGFPEPLLDKIIPLFFSPYTLAKKKELVSDFRGSLAHMKKENIPGVVALGRMIFSRDSLCKKLSSITSPTLLITGRDDIPRPPKEAEEMANHLPRSQVHIIEKAGHISNLEQPEIVTELLSQFFKVNLF